MSHVSPTDGVRTKSVDSGIDSVPQGIALSPLFFFIMVNDIMIMTLRTRTQTDLSDLQMISP